MIRVVFVVFILLTSAITAKADLITGFILGSVINDSDCPRIHENVYFNTNAKILSALKKKQNSVEVTLILNYNTFKQYEKAYGELGIKVINLGHDDLFKLDLSGF